MTKPITPREAEAKQADQIPDAVFESFNELIAESYQAGYAVVRQDAAIKRIREKTDCKTDEIFSRHWLNVEPAYRKAGWKVEYDKPGYNEDYEPTFKFERKKR